MRRIASSAIGAALAALAVTLASAVVILTPSPASSQAYPPACAPGAQELGNITVGQTFTFQLAPTCAFTPGATVSFTANGVTFTKTANASGTVDVTVNVVSATELTINPTAPARCGVNIITGVGPSAAVGGQLVTQTATFNLVCAAGVPRAATPVTGRLSLTGANVTRGGAAALVLLMVGAAMVTVGRRRASART